MNLVELHIAQSFPVTCVNRDDVGSPKTAVFGGVTRARISSQSLKRAARIFGRDNYEKANFVGIRTRRLVELFVDELKTHGLLDEEAMAKTNDIRKALSKLDSKDESLVTTAVFLSPAEIKRVSAAVVAGQAANKAIAKIGYVDAADIALFGRMIANDPSLNVEAAAMFSHALSVHASRNDLDFFTAVDEVDNTSGAAAMGTLEFNASIYYRYVGLNLDLVATHLKHMTDEQRRDIVEAFLRSVLISVPGARRSTMNGNTLPGYVLGVAKKGQPLNLVNAFLKPCAPNLEEAERALSDHYDRLKRVWGITHLAEVTLSENGNTTLDQLIKTLSAYVS